MPNSSFFIELPYNEDMHRGSAMPNRQCHDQHLMEQRPGDEDEHFATY
jgi:hypothetical protein